MKRGFLKKATKATGTTVPREVEQAKRLQHELVPIPEIKIPKSVPLKGTLPTTLKSIQSLNYNLVTLPWPSIYRPMELSSVCLLFPGTKEKILALPNFPSPLISPSNSLQPIYSIRDAEGCGKGVFANVTIQPGELIICERPLIVLPVVMPYMPGMVEPDDMLAQMVNALPNVWREAFYALHNCKAPSTCKRIRGIIHTNCLDIGGLPGDYDGTYGAVCPDISRINHSCTPNAFGQWYLDSMSYHIRALRTIERGEQIFITYAAPLSSRRERREELLCKYSFTCSCPCCSLPKQESARSDIQRSVLRTAASNLPTAKDDNEAIKAWAADPSLPNNHIIKHSLKIVDLMAQERLHDEDIGIFYYSRLCKVYCALENREAAKKWAEKSAVMAMVLTGNDGGWNKVVASPERTEWWGLRKNTPG